MKAGLKIGMGNTVIFDQNIRHLSEPKIYLLTLQFSVSPRCLLLTISFGFLFNLLTSQHDNGFGGVFWSVCFLDAEGCCCKVLTRLTFSMA